MGPLEDAIREHLELMRRRGADPAQIARAESEALSPATREVEAPAAREDAGDLVSGTEPVLAPEPPVGDDDDSDVIVPFEDEPRVASAAAEVDEEAPLSVDQPTAHFDTLGDSDPGVEEAKEEGLWDDEVLHAQDASVDGPESEPAADRRDDDQEERPAGDDVLEETPDFLAETPDHDKLWFEQTGPRDFDFDDEGS